MNKKKSLNKNQIYGTLYKFSTTFVEKKMYSIQQFHIRSEVIISIIFFFAL